MKLGEFYRGIPLNLVTRLPPDEVARRLKASLTSPWRPFATGILGWVRRGRVGMFYRSGIFNYDGMPVLTGRIEPHPRGTLLRLLYRGRLGARLAFPIAFLWVGLGMFPFFVISGGLSAPGFGPGTAAILAIVVVVFLTLPLAIHAFAIRNAEARLETMAAFLRTTLDAKDTSVP